MPGFDYDEASLSRVKTNIDKFEKGESKLNLDDDKALFNDSSDDDLIEGKGRISDKILQAEKVLSGEFLEEDSPSDLLPRPAGMEGQVSPNKPFM